MALHTNGTLPHPAELAQVRAEVLTVRDPDASYRGAGLLDELDTLITDLDDAMQDAATARTVIADTETELEIIAASYALGITGSNETARKAALVLALAVDEAHKVHSQTVRHARASLFTAERRIAIVKQRIGLVRAALALVTHGDTD
jgi:hypothetical protein